ncbi:hypothetical protein MMPV_004881 [Pyropia vietnamensis]
MDALPGPPPASARSRTAAAVTAVGAVLTLVVTALTLVLVGRTRKRARAVAGYRNRVRGLRGEAPSTVDGTNFPVESSAATIDDPVVTAAAGVTPPPVVASDLPRPAVDGRRDAGHRIRGWWPPQRGPAAAVAAAVDADAAVAADAAATAAAAAADATAAATASVGAETNVLPRPHSTPVAPVLVAPPLSDNGRSILPPTDVEAVLCRAAERRVIDPVGLALEAAALSEARSGRAGVDAALCALRSRVLVTAVALIVAVASVAAVTAVAAFTMDAAFTADATATRRPAVGGATPRASIALASIARAVVARAGAAAIVDPRAANLLAGVPPVGNSAVAAAVAAAAAAVPTVTSSSPSAPTPPLRRY